MFFAIIIIAHIITCAFQNCCIFDSCGHANQPACTWTTGNVGNHEEAVEWPNGNLAM